MAYYDRSAASHLLNPVYTVFPIDDLPQATPDLEYGDKIYLPESLFIQLTSRNVASPYLFKLSVPAQKTSIYCSVREFSSREGQINIPRWMMKQLKIGRGEEVTLNNVMLQMGKSVAFRPSTYKFVERYPNAEEVLSQHLNKYSTLTRESTVHISVDNVVYSFDVVDLKPTRAVCILDTDLRFTLEEPLDIQEYESKRQDEQKEKQTFNKYSNYAQAFAQDSSEVSQQDSGEIPVSFTNIFTQKDEEEQSLAEKVGDAGYSIKRGAVNHAVSPTPTPGGGAGRTPTPLTVPMKVASPTGNAAMTQEEKEAKAKRDALIRQQRAALYGGGRPTAAKANPNAMTDNTKIIFQQQQQSEAPKFDANQQKLLGLDKELQGHVDLVTKKTNVELTTSVEGDWLVYRDQDGRLVKREEIKKSFWSNGVGNSIKK